MRRMIAMLLGLMLTASLLAACGTGTGLQDGYYTAQAAEFSHGWKEYITILVRDGSIISVEYNAENASGFIKSWDNAYMQNQLLEGQGEGSIDGMTGATSSHESFQILAKAVVEQARKGDSSIAFVDTAH